ncbi:TPA: hypothetical protein DCE37_18585 [Candidatus Latescibacteria bacterium]|nr:hypothetical protein [Candidatus Latescibacterota bacterium]
MEGGAPSQVELGDNARQAVERIWSMCAETHTEADFEDLVRAIGLELVRLPTNLYLGDDPPGHR